MKEGMLVFSPYQVASLRMFFAGLVLAPFAFKAWAKIPKQKMGLVIVSGVVGNFIPAYLFCVAETQIDSSLAGILNSLTPLFTIIVGLLFFNTSTNLTKITGILIGFIGLSFLMVSGKEVSLHNLSYAALVLVATLLYGINVNMVGRHLQNIGSLNIASIAFTFLIIPSALVLFFTGFFNYSFTQSAVQHSLFASAVLGIIGTSIATIMFYFLVKRAGVLFGSLVTYGIPVVAVGWGIAYGESLSLQQVGCLAIILLGVTIVNRGNRITKQS
jgi:drug/metabolite transporter (DMT)-like permease